MRLIIIGLLALAIGRTSLAAGVVADISQVGDSLHLELQGQNQWEYNIEKKSDKKTTTFEFEIPRLNESAVLKLKKWTNPLVESLNVKHDGADGKDVLVLKVKSTNLEAFDYLTDQPSRLIIDIFKAKSEDKKVAEAKPENKSAEVKTKNKAKAAKISDSEKLPQKGERKPSSTDLLLVNKQGPIEGGASPAVNTDEKMSGIFDGGDPNFDRFQIKDYEIKEDAIIASRENYYIDFPMLRMENNSLVRLNENQPLYEIQPKDTEENKQARLLLTLYNNKRYNVFLKAVDWFYKKYPNSEYDEIIRFIWADTHFAMWMQNRGTQDFDLAMTRYRQAIEKYPKSPLMERTRMLMGFASFDRGDYLGTLRLFQQHIHERPQSPNKDISRLAIADAYLKLARYDDSAQMYQEISKEASDKKYKTLGAFNLGDVEFQRGDHQKAIELYKAALAQYPESAAEFPNAFYNQASSYFHLQKPKESLQVFIDFLKKFPNHAYAGYAMTRVGELLDMMGAEKSRAIGAYLETQFRYGDHPSSVVARLHLLASRMRTMKEKELDKAVEEITQLTNKSNLPNIGQFSNVLISDGYASRGDDEKAINLLVKYYQSNPTTADTQLLSNRIVKDINLEIKSLVDAGNFIQALKTHNHYADNWLKGSDRVDTKFNVGQAFEQAGVFSEAEKLYRDSLNKMMAVRGTAQEKERNVFEHLPSTDKVELRLAACEMQLGNNIQAYDHMKAIKNPENLSEIEQIERIQMGARLLEQKGDLNSAARYLVELIKTWKGIPELVADPYLQLAELEIKNGKKEDAIQSLQKIDQLMQDSQGKVSANIHYRSMEILGNLYYDNNQSQKAVSVYEKLLEKYEKAKPVASIRYKVGEIYFKRGDLQKAADVWNGLKSGKNEVWYNLAQEQLKNSDWNNEYKKYIKRIPAMSERN